MKTKYQSGDEVQMVIKTQKQSQTGFFTNERLLMIKAGIVSYFSSIPKKFSGSARAIEMSGQVPKFTIAANEISKIELKGVQLSILVLKSKLISRDEFGQMVKGTKNIPEIHGKAKPDGGGYEQWIFKSEDEESLIEFYHLINLFRTNNPNFQPHLSEMVQGFQNKKNPRKKTMEPAVAQKMMPLQPSHRRSEVPQAKVHQITIQKKQQKPVLPFALAPQIEQQDVLKQTFKQTVQKSQEKDKIKVEEDEQNDEQERLNLVKDKINLINHPRMSIIEQKPGQDKASEMSKAVENNRPIFIEVIKTFDEPKQIQPQVIRQEVIQQRHPQQQHQQINNIQPEISQQKPVSQQKPISEQKQPIKTQNKVYKSQNSHSVSNPTFLEGQSKIQFEIKQQKRIKVNQMLKSAFSVHKSDYKKIAESLKIPVQELIQFLRVNKQEQDDNWEFIQNQLARVIGNKQNEYRQLKNLNIGTKVITKYHNLSDLFLNSDLKSYQLLEGEVSFDDFEQDCNEQNLIMQWLRSEISRQLSKSFSTKVFNKLESKISLRQIVFDLKQIITAKGSWVVNKGGFLLQFLAYLSLQKIVKQLKSKEKGKFQLECAQICYIKFKQYEALVKPLRVSNSYYPLRSIKALQFMSKSKGMKYFQKVFPQFIVNVEILKDEDIYTFHLQKTTSDCCQTSGIQNELKKLHFIIDSQLQVFYGTNQYNKLQTKCIDKLGEIQTRHKKINESILKELVSSAESNIQIDIIFKWLGARLDKNNQIIFEPTMLKLGGHQFGSQYSLIKKTRKKGNYQVSHSLGKKLISKLYFYRSVTPTQNFIAVYLHLIEMMILEKGQLHRAVPILLKISQFLSDYQVQKYSVYLALMRSYIKLHQIQNFIKTMQNCRLFLYKMFQQNAIIFDFPFHRTIIAINTYQQPLKGLQMSQKLIQSLINVQNLPSQLKQKMVSKLIWDKCNIYINGYEYPKAYQVCHSQLQLLQNTQGCLQGYWIQGVLCSAKSWLQMQEVNPFNSAKVQKRVERAISLALSLELLDIAFLLKDYGQKILQKCKQLHLPRFLQNQAAFQQAKIQFNNARDQMLELIVQVE